MNLIRTTTFFTFLFLASVKNIAQENYIKVNNINIYIEDVGVGQPIIFIPGWTMTTKFFKKQKSYFKKDFRFISFDPRSHGKSTKTELGNNYTTHAVDLKEIIEKLNLTNVILVGWSSGCATIYEYIKSNGLNKIDRLVFIDEPPKWIGNPEKEWVYGTFEDYRESLKDLIKDRSKYASGTVEWMLKENVDFTVKKWMVQQMLLTPLDAALSLYIDGMASDYNPILKSINMKVPMLFFVSPYTYNNAKKWLNSYVTSATIIPIESHATFWEKPDSFNSELKKFIKKN